MAKRLGALVIFRPDVTMADAERALIRLAEEGLIEGNEGTGATAFDPDREGWPVWYIP